MYSATKIPNRHIDLKKRSFEENASQLIEENPCVLNQLIKKLKNNKEILTFCDEDKENFNHNVQSENITNGLNHQDLEPNSDVQRKIICLKENLNFIKNLTLNPSFKNKHLMYKKPVVLAPKNNTQFNRKNASNSPLSDFCINFTDSVNNILHRRGNNNEILSNSQYSDQRIQQNIDNGFSSLSNQAPFDRLYTIQEETVSDRLEDEPSIDDLDEINNWKNDFINLDSPSYKNNVCIRPNSFFKTSNKKSIVDNRQVFMDNNFRDDVCCDDFSVNPMNLALDKDLEESFNNLDKVFVKKFKENFTDIEDLLEIPRKSIKKDSPTYKHLKNVLKKKQDVNMVIIDTIVQKGELSDPERSTNSKKSPSEKGLVYVENYFGHRKKLTSPSINDELPFSMIPKLTDDRFMNVVNQPISKPKISSRRSKKGCYFKNDLNFQHILNASSSSSDSNKSKDSFMFQEIGNIQDIVKLRKKTSISSPNIINLKEMQTNQLKQNQVSTNLNKTSFDDINPSLQKHNTKVPNIKIDISSDNNIQLKSVFSPTIYNPYEKISSKSPKKDSGVNYNIDMNKKKISARSSLVKTKSTSINKYRRNSEQYNSMTKRYKNKSMNFINTRSNRVGDYISRVAKLNEGISKFDNLLKETIKKSKREKSNDSKGSHDSKPFLRNSLLTKSIDNKKNEKYYKCKTYRNISKPFKSLFCNKLKDSQIFKTKPISFESDPIKTSLNLPHKMNSKSINLTNNSSEKASKASISMTINHEKMDKTNRLSQKTDKSINVTNKKLFLQKPLDLQYLKSKKYRAMNRSSYDYTKKQNWNSFEKKLEKSNDNSTKTKKSHNSEQVSVRNIKDKISYQKMFSKPESDALRSKSICSRAKPRKNVNHHMNVLRQNKTNFHESLNQIQPNITNDSIQVDIYKKNELDSLLKNGNLTTVQNYEKSSNNVSRNINSKQNDSNFTFNDTIVYKNDNSLQLHSAKERNTEMKSLNTANTSNVQNLEKIKVKVLPNFQKNKKRLENFLSIKTPSTVVTSIKTNRTKDLVSTDERPSQLSTIRAKKSFLNNNSITNRSSIMDSSHLYQTINENISNKENVNNQNNSVKTKNESVTKNSGKVVESLALKTNATNVLKTGSRLFQNEKNKGNQILNKLRNKRMI